MPSVIITIVLLVGCLCLPAHAQEEGQRAGAGPAAKAPKAPVSATIPEGTTVRKDLAYVSDENPQHKLDLYLPATGKPSYPTIIWIHGGGFHKGDKDNKFRAVFLLQYGYAVASINYRLSSEAIFPAQIHDCKAAVRWLRAHASEYKLDPKRFGAWGSSAGGHLAALLGTSGDVKELEGTLGNLEYSSRVQAVCDWFGPTDLTRLPNAVDPSDPASLLVGGLVKEHMDKANAANPITHVSKDAPPFLVMHGDQDKKVPIEQSKLLCEALQQAGVPVTFIAVEGLGHGGKAFRSAGDAQTQTLDPVRAFFDKQFKAGETGKQESP